MDAVYNETVSVVEIEEGLDGETFFLYVFLAALVVLMLVVGQHFLTSFSKKSSSRKAPVERGTIDSDDVDYEWLPEQTLRGINSKLFEHLKISFIYTMYFYFFYFFHRSISEAKPETTKSRQGEVVHFS